MKKTKHGGKRNGAGRKPAEDPKIAINIYPLTSQVKKIGGKDKVKAIAIKAVEEASNSK
jgi:hypothetical protein